MYRGDGLSFRIGEVPPSWARLDVKNARLAFRDESAESTVLVNARCGKDSDDVPLQALTQHLFMMFTERETLEQKVVPMDGREAMHTVLRAKLDGVPKMFDAYVLMQAQQAATDRSLRKQLPALATRATVDADLARVRSEEAVVTAQLQQRRAEVEQLQSRLGGETN